MNICNNRLPSIIIKDGVISLKKSVTTALGLHPGDVVNFYADNGELFLYRQASSDVIGDYEGRCLATNKGRSGNLRVYSKAMSNGVLSYCKEDKEVRLALGDKLHHPIIGECLTIITKLKL